MSRLVVLRHGESTWNRLNLFTGWHDVPLSDAGRVEARAAGDTLREKVRLDPGETVLYLQDDTGTLYRTRFIVPEGDAKEITVRVAAFE